MAEPNPSAAPGDPAVPAVEFAEWLPALGGSRLLRVHGAAAGGSVPALVLETPSGEHRIEPRAQARFTRAHEWRASYLIASEVAAAGWAATTLEWPDGTRVHLPEPTEPGAEVVDPTVLAGLRARRDAESPPDRTPPAEPSSTFATPAPGPSPPAPAVRAGKAASPGTRSWADPPGAFSGSVFEAEATWTAKRAELERELTRAAEAIARAERGERVARDAVLTALAAMRADLRAAHAARAADADTIATLKGELEAERIAHAVTRRTASTLRAALAQSRRHRPEDLRTALEAERKARAEAEEALRQTERAGSALMQRIAELSRAHELDREALERHAREQAKTAAEADRRPERETGELVANLEAAAASLRASTRAVADDAACEGLAEQVSSPRELLPAEPTTSDFAALSDALAGPPARPLRRVLVALAERDPVAAGEVLAGLLPAQGAVFDAPVAYDLTIEGVGTFAITVSDGIATIERASKRRSRSEALFELRSDPLTLAELLAGEAHRIGRFRGRARISRRRRKARVLDALPAAKVSLAEALRAGVRLEPALVYKALPLAIDPEWTAGHEFTIAQEITDPDARTWYLAVRDGAGIEVTESAPDAPPNATVTMTRAAFERLLRDEPPDPGERPLVRGDRAAVAILKAWMDRARGAV